MPPSVLHLSTYDANGGAARAAYALHRAMVDSGVRSSMRVASRTVDDPTVTGDLSTALRVTQRLDRQVWRLQRSPNRTWRSPAVFGCLRSDEINASPADVVNLHWVTNGFLSIREIGRITKPVVWSLYDMWPFAGTEHYGADTPAARWRTGYTKQNRPRDESGLDIDRMAWERKRAAWTRPSHVVAASTWLHDCSQRSALFGAWPQHRIPHVIDCEAFCPADRQAARASLGLPRDRPLVLFLASAGVTDERKGWDLLERSMSAVRARHPDVELVVVGPPSPQTHTSSGVPVHWRGSVSGDTALAMHYNAANVTAVPSRDDNMPLTAMEAQSCGRPVVAFAIGGLTDIVGHHETGYLARPFDTDALATGVIEALDDSLHADVWGLAARERAIATWSRRPVVDKYLDVYAEAVR